MPSPLSADALASPSAPSLQRPAPTQTPNGSAAGVAAADGHGQHDILSEINAHLNGRSTTRGASSSPTAAPPTQPPVYFSNHIDAASPSTPHHHERSTLNGISGSGSHPSASGSVGLAEHARGLFQAAQARLPRDVFAEFVGLVQQFRVLSSSSHGGNDARAWGEVRGRAAVLLAQHPDIYAHFEQLLHATQLQQQQQR
jgi:hypothetical protein